MKKIYIILCILLLSILITGCTENGVIEIQDIDNNTITTQEVKQGENPILQEVNQEEIEAEKTKFTPKSDYRDRVLAGEEYYHPEIITKTNGNTINVIATDDEGITQLEILVFSSHGNIQKEIPIDYLRYINYNYTLDKSGVYTWYIIARDRGGSTTTENNTLMLSLEGAT